MRVLLIAGGMVAMTSAALAAETGVSIERGLQVSISHGCHDCHTANYFETDGKVDPALSLKGTSIGWRGPWGTTYPMNLRLTAVEKAKNEDEFVKYAKSFKTRPPMPWFNVHAMDEGDLRSLYRYIKSLGEPGEQVPEAVAPGEEPKTPYYPLIPPTMPKG